MGGVLLSLFPWNKLACPRSAKINMRWSRNFRQGGSRSVWQKSSDNVFLVLSLFYRSQLVIFKEIDHFSRLQRGIKNFRGVQLFPGGSKCLFPIETHITCDFPGGGGSGSPVPPLDPHLIKTLFSYVPCSPILSLFPCSPQNLAFVPLK